MGQPFDLLSHPVPSKYFQGLDDASMQCSPPLLEEAAIGYLVCQGMFEGIFQLGEKARLVQEFRCLKV